MRSGSAPLLLSLALAGLPAVAGVAAADGPLSVPMAESAPTRDEARDALVVVARGEPSHRVGTLSARRPAARREAVARARELLHGFVDDALAAASAPPAVADRAHRAVDEGARTVATRALMDGGALVRVELPLAVLREAADLPGVPWSP